MSRLFLSGGDDEQDRHAGIGKLVRTRCVYIPSSVGCHQQRPQSADLRLQVGHCPKEVSGVFDLQVSETLSRTSKTLDVHYSHLLHITTRCFTVTGKSIIVEQLPSLNVYSVSTTDYSGIYERTLASFLILLLYTV